MRKIVVDGTPHLCIFALKDIHEGSELRYDYGVPEAPWRKKRYLNSITVTRSEIKTILTMFD
jgi:SET domain-containing protein